MRSILLLVLVLACQLHARGNGNLTTLGLRPDDTSTESVVFTEQTKYGVKPGSGIAFSGGGFRALTVGAGVLQQMEAKQKTVDYLAGTSGGFWLSSIYTYLQPSSITTKRAANDEELLGVPQNPSTLTESVLKTLSKTRLIHVTTRSFLEYMIPILIEIKAGLSNPQLLWHHLVGSWILAPFMDGSKSFTYNQQSADEIQAENPSVKNLLQPFNENRPYVIGLSSVVGSYAQSPIDLSKSSPAIPCEWTPLYSSFPLLNKGLQYVQAGNDSNQLTDISVGGYKQSFSQMGKPKDEITFIDPTTGDASFQVDSSQYGLAAIEYAVGASSDAPSYFFQTNYAAEKAKGNKTLEDLVLTGMVDELLDTIEEYLTDFTQVALGPEFPFYPIVDDHKGSHVFTQSDGGYVSYTPIQPLMIRNVGKILAVVSSCTALGNATEYDPSEGYVKGMVPSSFAAYFGFDTGVGYDQYTHVFEQSQFAPFITAMQENMAKGNGAMHRATFTTVDNAQFGITAGQTFDIAFYFMASIPEQWISQLPAETQADIAAGADGPYEDFPCFSDEMAYSAQMTNLLNSMSSYAMELNWDLVADIFEDQSVPSSSPSSSGDDDLSSMIKAKLRGGRN